MNSGIILAARTGCEIGPQRTRDCYCRYVTSHHSATFRVRLLEDASAFFKPARWIPAYVVEIPRDHPQRRVWKDLRTLAIVTSGREIDGEETWETRLYVTSHAPRAKPLARAIRKHWSIENSQHWSLDVMFGEDSRRQQDRHGATNLAAVRRLTVSLLRQEQTLKRGAKCKRMACAVDPNYLVRVLHNAKIGA